MLSVFLQQLWASTVTVVAANDLYILSVFIVPALVLIMWRVWTFTVRPALNPREPREIPYWIPGKLGCRLKSHDNHLSHANLCVVIGKTFSSIAVPLPKALIHCEGHSLSLFNDFGGLLVDAA